MTEKNSTNIAKQPLFEQLGDGKMPVLTRYKKKVLGDGGSSGLLKYEIASLFINNLGGGLGYFLRYKFYRSLFRQLGIGCILGRGMTIRCPGRISIGANVSIDDNTLLDGFGASPDAVVIGDSVIISRNCVIQGKTGFVRIGYKTDIGCNTVITSSSGISIGSHVLVGANCYIGGGQYRSDNLDQPMMLQGIYTKGPVVIGSDVWIGAGAIVLDGARIGNGCIIGAGAVVTKKIPDYSIAVGVPARVVDSRKP